LRLKELTSAMPQDVPSRSIGELTYPDISKRLRASSILCLPIGSIEQHGPHLPLNTDVVLAEEFTRRIVARWGDTYDLWQLPTQAVSLAREHDWAPGTLSLSIEGMTRLIRDLGREIARSLPARNLAIINGHGGNRGILEALAQDLRGDFNLNVCILHPTTWADIHAASKTPEIHGGRNETSMMLATAPHLVRADEIKKLQAASGADAVRTTILDQAVTWPWTTNEKAIADAGIIGDAKSASAEFGKQLLEKITDVAGGVFKQLLERQQLLRG
jgi:creatinine amidohydrolase